jgi:2-methylisocitrate lyase-like PEP mutase family enzyme
VTSASTLRRLLAGRTTPLVVPGGATPLEALAIEDAGFDAMYLSGYALAAWRHGLPDLGLHGAAETASALEAIVRVIDIPVVVDADTGYGDAVSVWSTVRRLEQAGAAAIQLEDQTWPKKCGHMVGKTVIDAGEAAAKIEAATEARTDADTVIIARTDSLAPLGLAEAIARAAAYREAGADALFIDAPPTVEALREIAASLPHPLIVNVSEGGMTPALAADEYYEMGFDIVLFPTSALRIAARAITSFLGALRETPDSRPLRDRMFGLDELNDLVRIDDYLAIGDRALSAGPHR